MCLICKSIDTLTFVEGLRNLREIEETLDAKHYHEVLSLLSKKMTDEDDSIPKDEPTRLYRDYLMFL